MIRFVAQLLGLDPEQPSLLRRKEELVLDLLGKGEMFGLDLVEASNGVLKRGTVYVLLAHMERENLIVGRKVKKVLTRKDADEREHETVIHRRIYRKGIPVAKVVKVDAGVHSDPTGLLPSGD